MKFCNLSGLARFVILGMFLGSAPALIYVEDVAVAAQPRSTQVSSQAKSRDWASQWLLPFVKRYDCGLVGTHKNSQSSRIATRFELAALLSSCLKKIDNRFVNKEDFLTAQALQKEFEQELTAIQARSSRIEELANEVAAQRLSLPNQVAAKFFSCEPVTLRPEAAALNLEDDRSISQQKSLQFSPTTKSIGEVVYSSADSKKIASSASRKKLDSALKILENRTSVLQDHAAALNLKQFSPTTKIQGQTVITIQSGGFR